MMNLFGSKKENAKKQPAKSTPIPKTVQQTIPYVALYSNGILQVAAERFSRVYSISDINFRTESDEEQAGLYQRFCQLLNTLSDVDIELCSVNKKADIEKFKEKHFLKFSDDGLNVYRNEINEIMLGNLEKGNSIENTKYIVLTMNADNIDVATQQFDRMHMSVVEAVKGVGDSQAELLTTEQLLVLYHSIYNPDEDVPPISLEDMKKQGMTTKDYIAPSAIKLSGTNIILGEKYCMSLGLTMFPSSLSTEFMADLNALPFFLTTAVHLTAMPQEEATKLVRNQIVNINANIIEQQKKAAQKGYSGGLISPDLAASRDEAMALFDDLSGKNQKLYFATVVATVYADSEDEMKQYAQLVRSTGAKYLCVFKPLKQQQAEGVVASIPMGINNLEIKRLLTTESAALFMPFSAIELAQEDGLYYGLNAVSNNMILFNRLRSRNSNGVILGTPGAGKSFSSKREMVSVFLGTDADVNIVDPEGEYRPLATMLHGEVIRIAAGSNNYINPLDMDMNYADDDDPITLKADFICSLCETAIAGRYGLTPIQKSIIDRCVREVYKPYVEYMHEHPEISSDKEKSPTLLDFYELLLAQPEPEAQGIALSFERYCVGSLDIFAHRTNVNVSSRFLVYDIKDIGTGLKEFGLQVCLNDIWNRTIANKSKNKRTWFYLDEFYLLTQTESSAKFLQQIYKRARKWGGVPTGITQNVEDLLASREARSILNNCDFVMMLNQSPIDRAELAQMFNISPAMQQYITNASPGHGILYTGRTIVPFVDEYPRDTESFKAMTTNPNDVK